jgi:hypothetical protein
MEQNKKMVNKKSWGEFRETGLFLILNQFLHIFGWALVCVLNNGTITEVFPARVRYRGFDESSTSKAYLRISKYMSKNSKELLEEAEEE